MGKSKSLLKSKSQKILRLSGHLDLTGTQILGEKNEYSWVNVYDT